MRSIASGGALGNIWGRVVFLVEVVPMDESIVTAKGDFMEETSDGVGVPVRPIIWT